MYNADVELDNAKKLFKKKLKDIKEDDIRVKKQKISRFLAGKGFSYETISNLMNTELK